MDSFPIRRADRAIVHGIDVARRADRRNDIRADGRRLVLGNRLWLAVLFAMSAELGLLATFAFMAVYLLVGTPWVFFVTT